MLLSKISFVVIVLCYKVNMMIIFIVCSLNPNELLVYWIRTRIYKKKNKSVHACVEYFFLNWMEYMSLYPDYIFFQTSSTTRSFQYLMGK